MTLGSTIGLALLVVVAQAPLSQARPPKAPPVAKRSKVTDTYHGAAVADPYRWLEDWKDAKVKAWSNAQNTWARRSLARVKGVESLRQQVNRVTRSSSGSYSGISYRGTARAGQLFAIWRAAGKQQPLLVTMPVAEGSSFDPARAKPVVDPNVLDPKGRTHIDWYLASPKGDRVAVSMSVGGTESGDVTVHDSKTGKQIGHRIVRVNGGTAGGDLCWAADGKGFFYTRYPRAGERPKVDLDFYMQLFFHRIGTDPKEDTYELGKGLPRIAEIQLDCDPGSGRVLATIQKGDGGEFELHLRDPDGRWRQFASFGDKVLEARFGPADSLYVLSRAGAPRGKIHRVPVSTLDVASAPVIIPQGKDTIENDFWGGHTIVPTKNRLYVVYQLGGPTEIRVFDPSGKRQPAPDQMAVGAIRGLAPLGGDDVLFGNRSYVSPLQWRRYEAKTGKTQRTPLSKTATVDMSDARVVREFAVSSDGTRVPVNIVLLKNAKRNGKAACLASGYGGFGLSRTPRFRSWIRLLLDRGMCYADANLRGGSEFGADWHEGGRLTKKQNVFDDFSAVLQHLVKRRYTTAKRLGIMGGSNGGLLMGAAMVQHPRQMGAVISYVGIYDMLRVELSPNGTFNVTEFGTVTKPDHFRAMVAYSPYHNVKKRVAYPPALFLTGENDPRVDPMQSRKMVARLQNATTRKRTILLRTNKSGHGSSTGRDERIEEWTAVFTFLFKHLGVPIQTTRKDGAK